MRRYKIIDICVSTVCIFLGVLILVICIVKLSDDGDRLHSRDSNNIWTNDHIISSEDQSALLETTEISDQIQEQVIQEVPLIDLTRLPQGYTCEAQENGSIRIFKDSTVIGAVDVYSIPGGEQTDWDPYFRWLGSLGIPDLSDDSLWCMGGSSLHGNWEMHFGSDVPPGQVETVDRYHTFYVGRTKVWDVWFDLMVIDRSEMDMLLDAITIQ